MARAHLRKPALQAGPQEHTSIRNGAKGEEKGMEFPGKYPGDLV